MFSALVVGSLVPDLPYFLLLGENKGIGHSIRGAFLFCLPAALALLWIFHVVLKRPLVALAPEWMRRRVSEDHLRFAFGPWRRFLWVVSSVLVGTFSHILWDGFTHEHGYFVKRWAALSIPVTTYRVMPLWHALQYGCSVIGVGLVMLFATLWWVQKPELAHTVVPDMTPRLRWFIVAVALLIALLTGASVAFDRMVHQRIGWKGSLIDSVIVCITALLLETLVFSGMWHASRRSRPELVEAEGSVREGRAGRR